MFEFWCDSPQKRVKRNAIWSEGMLDRVLGNMRKKTKKVNRGGRTEEISAEKLLERFRALKRVLEDNWGRIGLKLQRVRNPNDVKEIFTLLPGVEWYPPFRDYSAKCFLEEESCEVSLRELRQTQKRHEEAINQESKCRSEYYRAQQEAYAAKTALNSFIGDYKSAKCLIHFLRRVFEIAKELEVKSLAAEAAVAEGLFHEAREYQQRLRQQRSSEEAWFARKEVVEFARSSRYERNAVNFAKAMAGLPDYSWIHSFRKCPYVKEDPMCPATLNYQLFKLLETVVKKARPFTLKNIETTLREGFLSRDPQDLLRVHFAPSWAFIQQGIDCCKGKRIKRSEAAYMLMEKIQENLERGKTITEMELAKRKRLF